MTSIRSLSALALAAAVATTALSQTAEARNGRNAAFAAGAAIGVLGGAAIAGSAYRYPAYGYGYGYGGYPAYNYPSPVYSYPNTPTYGCYGDPYCGPPPSYRSVPRVVYEPEPVYVPRERPYYYDDASDIARWRFENRK